MIRIREVKDEFYDYLQSIEQDGKLSHLTPNSPEIQKLRIILGMRPTIDTGNLLNSDKVRELIKEKGLSQQKVAKMIGKGSSWLSKSLVNGRMGMESMQKVAELLNVDVEEIQG